MAKFLLDVSRVVVIVLLASVVSGIPSAEAQRRRTVPAESAVVVTEPGSYPVRVVGGDEASFTPTARGQVTLDKEAYDTIVVGGGLAGLTSAVYLSDQKQRVLLLEKEPTLGGLASGGRLSSGVRYDRGAAYWTSAYEEEQKILDHIGLKNFAKVDAIDEPIDSYLWNGKLYKGIWEKETLDELPASFSVFKQELKKTDEAGLIPNQPLEEAADKGLDRLSAAQWVRSMPARLAKRSDAASRKILARFAKDPHVSKADPMLDVIGLLDLYCRSALGAATDKVSALAFANFYISEIETRYTTPIGTGMAARNMSTLLRKREQFVALKVNSPVAGIKQTEDQVRVLYIDNATGQSHEARAAHVVFAAQLKLAPKLIDGFAEKEPQRTALIDGMDYAHYSVHAVLVDGHPYRASYDTWTRASDYSDFDFTDVILGRWMEKSIKGYKGYRDFKRDPDDNNGIMTIYHPLPKSFVGRGYSTAEAAAVARRAVERMISLYSSIARGPIEVRSVETNRWPYSVHVAKPGHFLKDARVLRRPFGRIFFANNNLGTPAFEEALFRGHCAANNILRRTDARFQFESWTHCPYEK